MELVYAVDMIWSQSSKITHCKKNKSSQRCIYGDCILFLSLTLLTKFKITDTVEGYSGSLWKTSFSRCFKFPNTTILFKSHFSLKLLMFADSWSHVITGSTYGLFFSLSCNHGLRHLGWLEARNFGKKQNRIFIYFFFK